MARARYLRRPAQAILDEVDDLAERARREGGVPRTEALLAELCPSVGGLHALADDGPRALRDSRLGRSAAAARRPAHGARPRAARRRSASAAGAASPWAEAVLETGAALLAGNGVVLSAAVPAAAARLEATAARAGLPEGLLQRVGRPRTAATVVVETGVPGPKGAILVLDGAPLDRADPGRAVGGVRARRPGPGVGRARGRGPVAARMRC